MRLAAALALLATQPAFARDYRSYDPSSHGYYHSTDGSTVHGPNPHGKCRLRPSEGRLSRRHAFLLAPSLAPSFGNVLGSRRGGELAIRPHEMTFRVLVMILGLLCCCVHCAG